MLLRLAAAGRPVAFITLGDAMLYSTWSYVLSAVLRLAPGADVRTIPGVTAMSACAAAVGRPLAEGREPLLVWPDEPPTDAAALLDLAPNVVFMKAGRHLAALAAVAGRAGAEAVAVRRASQARARRPRRDLRSWSADREYFTTVLMHRAGGARRAPQSEEDPHDLLRRRRPGRPRARHRQGSPLARGGRRRRLRGSLVPKAVLGWTRDGCELHDSAGHGPRRAGRGDGRRRTRPARRSCACTPVTRACTARSASRCAPSTPRGSSYAVVPGVSSFVAAAAALPDRAHRAGRLADGDRHAPAGPHAGARGPGPRRTRRSPGHHGGLPLGRRPRAARWPICASTTRRRRPRRSSSGPPGRSRWCCAARSRRSRIRRRRPASTARR